MLFPTKNGEKANDDEETKYKREIFIGEKII